MGNPSNSDGTARRRPEEQQLGPVLRRRGQVQAGSTTDQRLLDSAGPTEWVHTDPWRVLRIQSEFIEASARSPSCRRRSASSDRPAHPRAPRSTRPACGSAARWWTPDSR